jgi:hypothetical protein
MSDYDMPPRNLDPTERAMIADALRRLEEQLGDRAADAQQELLVQFVMQFEDAGVDTTEIWKMYEDVDRMSSSRE